MSIEVAYVDAKPRRPQLATLSLLFSKEGDIGLATSYDESLTGPQVDSIRIRFNELFESRVKGMRSELVNPQMLQSLLNQAVNQVLDEEEI